MPAFSPALPYALAGAAVGRQHRPRKSPYAILSRRQQRRAHVRLRGQQRYGLDLTTRVQASLLHQLRSGYRCWLVGSAGGQRQFWVIERHIDRALHVLLVVWDTRDHDLTTVYPWPNLRNHLDQLPPDGQDAVIRYLNFRTDGGLW